MPSTIFGRPLMAAAQFCERNCVVLDTYRCHGSTAALLGLRGIAGCLAALALSSAACGGEHAPAAAVHSDAGREQTAGHAEPDAGAATAPAAHGGAAAATTLPSCRIGRSIYSLTSRRVRRSAVTSHACATRG